MAQVWKTCLKFRTPGSTVNPELYSCEEKYRSKAGQEHGEETLSRHVASGTSESVSVIAALR